MNYYELRGTYMNLDELMDVQLIIIKDVKNHFLEIAKLSFNFNFECN